MTEDQFRYVLKQLLRQAWEVQTALDVWLFEHKKRGAYRKASTINALRLLKLKVWSIRHEISVEECVDILIPAFNKFQWGGRTPSRFGTGISIQTLTSANAERILEREIVLRYPEGEHRTIYRQELCRKQLELERLDEMDGLTEREPGPKTLLEAESPEEYVSSYRSRVTKQREENDRLYNQSWRRRKPYRENPWRGD